jgi:hypothetical protein
MADRVRQSVLAEELSPEEADDPAARSRLAGRRLARILRLSGDCQLNASAHVTPARGSLVEPVLRAPVESSPPRASLLPRAPLPPAIPRDDAFPSPVSPSNPPTDTIASRPPSMRPRIPRDAASSPPPASLRPSIPRDDSASAPPPSMLPHIPRDPVTKTPPPPVSITGPDSSKPPPSMRPRIAVPVPDEPASAETYAGPRVSIPANAPIRSRTPPPPALRTPPPPSLRAPPSPTKTPQPASISPDSTPPAPAPGRKSSEFRRVALPPSIPPPAAAATPATSAALIRQSVIGRVVQLDFSGADRILRERRVLDAPDPEIDALSIWVRANLQSDLEGPLASLNLLLHTNPKCEHALYYRGLLLKKSGQRKAALRDFVTVAKQNPRHGAALFEIKELRSFGDE